MAHREKCLICNFMLNLNNRVLFMDRHWQVHRGNLMREAPEIAASAGNLIPLKYILSTHAMEPFPLLQKLETPPAALNSSIKRSVN